MTNKSSKIDQWLFKSETYDNCNCAVNCGCQFNIPSTHGYCQSAFVGNIVAGHFNDTPLAELNWAALYKWPGEIKEGNGKRQIVIDERPYSRLHAQNFVRHCSCRYTSKRTWNSEPQGLRYRAS